MELTVPTAALDVPATLGRASLGRLLAQLDAAEGPVLVARGSEEGFCAGLDIAVLTEAGAREVGEVLDLCVRCLVRLATLPLPTVAVVTGRASGGGVGLVAACDVVIATPRATFALPEALFGLRPAMIAPLLDRRVTPAAVRRMSLTGSAIDAAEAHRIGLVDEVVEPARLEGAVTRALRSLGRGRPEAVARLKADPALERAVAAGRADTEAALADPEVRARVRGFLSDGLAPWAAGA